MGAIEPCANCQEAIVSAADALYHDKKWFCGYKCHNEFLLRAMASRCPADKVCVKDHK